MARKTGLVWHETLMWAEHGKYAGILPATYPVQPGRHHENPETKRRLKNLLDACGLTDQLVALAPRPASRQELARVHTAAYLDTLERLDGALAGSVGLDAAVTQGGVSLARLAAGGCIVATDAILERRVDNAYALVRPVGHHAEPGEGKGFCLLANPSLAAAHALDRHGLERVAIVDIDVHHGNGAEKIFWTDPRVLTVSVHQARWFPPDSGDLEARGAAAGFGTNLNIPLPAGSGIGAYRATMERVILPALERFKPQLLVVPCGYDAAAQDPLGRMLLDSPTYRWMMEQFVAAAGRLCDGRLLVTHEGGYNEFMVPFLGLAVMEALSGIESGVVDPHAQFFHEAPGQELQPHQELVVTAAAKLVAGIPAKAGK